jgi:hypothetical protein
MQIEPAAQNRTLTPDCKLSGDRHRDGTARFRLELRHGSFSLVRAIAFDLVNVPVAGC